MGDADTTDEPAGRNPGEVEMLTRAWGLARQIFDALTEDVKERIDADDFSTLTDEQALALAHATISSEWMDARQQLSELSGPASYEPARGQTCGWCLRAAGLSLIARIGAKRYTFEEAGEHTLTCEHNPFVVENDRLRAELTAMQPVVDAAVAYGMSPSGCHRSEARLVEAAGTYHANRRISMGVSPLGTISFRDGKLVDGEEK